MTESKATVGKLLERLDKEIARVGELPSTAAVGGLTKAGNLLETLLRDVLVEALKSTGTTLDRELRGRSRGAGTYALLLAETQPQDPVARILVADIRRGRSTSIVLGYIEHVRNDNNHPGGVDPVRGKRAMQQLKQLLLSIR